MSIDRRNIESEVAGARARQYFFTDIDSITDEEYWKTQFSEKEFRPRVEERLRRNHPDLVPKYDGSDPTFSLDNAMMQTSVWLIMVVRENRWRIQGPPNPVQ